MLNILFFITCEEVTRLAMLISQIEPLPKSEEGPPWRHISGLQESTLLPPSPQTSFEELLTETSSSHHEAAQWARRLISQITLHDLETRRNLSYRRGVDYPSLRGSKLAWLILSHVDFLLLLLLESDTFATARVALSLSTTPWYSGSMDLSPKPLRSKAPLPKLSLISCLKLMLLAGCMRFSLSKVWFSNCGFLGCSWVTGWCARMVGYACGSKSETRGFSGWNLKSMTPRVEEDS